MDGSQYGQLPSAGRELGGNYRIPPNDDDRHPREILLPEPDVVAINRGLLAVPERERQVL